MNTTTIAWVPICIIGVFATVIAVVWLNSIDRDESSARTQQMWGKVLLMVGVLHLLPCLIMLWLCVFGVVK